METKPPTASGKPKARWSWSALVVLLSLCFIGTALLTEGCADPPKPEGTTQEVTHENHTTEATPEATETSSPTEATPEPTTESIAPEPGTPEATPEPGTPEPGSDEPADAGEMLADARDGGPDTPCTGLQGPYPDVTGTSPPEIDIPEGAGPEDGCKYMPGQCVGSSVPSWVLEDFQPQSCGYQKSYNLTAFKGYVTVVALLSGW